MVATLTDVYYAVGPLFNAPRTSSMTGETNHLKLIFLTVGTTTAERFEETSLGWIGCRLILILSPPPFSRYWSTHVSAIPLPTVLPSLLNFSKEVWASTAGFTQCPAKKKWQPAANIGGEQTQYDLQSWRRPSHIGQLRLCSWRLHTYTECHW